jgi:glutamyl-Q tRNA(Asp) synthetase
VTGIVRSRDLVASASVHRLLQALLGLPVPIYHHHRLILDQAGKALENHPSRLCAICASRA